MTINVKINFDKTIDSSLALRCGQELNVMARGLSPENLYPDAENPYDHNLKNFAGDKNDVVKALRSMLGDAFLVVTETENEEKPDANTPDTLLIYVAPPVPE